MDNQHSVTDAALWLVLVMVLFIALWVLWVVLRRWYSRQQHSGSLQAPWSLQELRDLRQQGEITEEEYTSMYQQITEIYKDTAQSGRAK